MGRRFSAIGKWAVPLRMQLLCWVEVVDNHVLDASCRLHYCFVDDDVNMPVCLGHGPGESRNSHASEHDFAERSVQSSTVRQRPLRDPNQLPQSPPR